MRRSLAFVLTLVPLAVWGHALAPLKQNVIVNDGSVTMKFIARNWYDSTTNYRVEAFFDKELTQQYEIRAVPSEISLGSKESKRFYVVAKNPPEKFYVCTTSVEGRQANMALASRVCSTIRTLDRTRISEE